MRRKEKGFSLLEVMAVVAVLGILLLVALPNLWNAIQRSRQRRTMVDMRALGMAVEGYAADHDSYPSASCAIPILPSQLTTLTAESFEKLAPTYIAQVPRRDGWGRYYGYFVDPSGGYYLIQSSGAKDTGFEPIQCSETADFNEDIAFSNGSFIQSPLGGIPPGPFSLK
jgi:type II secretion system protein G